MSYSYFFYFFFPANFSGGVFRPFSHAGPFARHGKLIVLLAFYFAPFLFLFIAILFRYNTLCQLLCSFCSFTVDDNNLCYRSFSYRSSYSRFCNQHFALCWPRRQVFSYAPIKEALDIMRKQHVRYGDECSIPLRTQKRGRQTYGWRKTDCYNFMWLIAFSFTFLRFCRLFCLFLVVCDFFFYCFRMFLFFFFFS